MKNKAIFMGLILVLITLLVSGCLDFFTNNNKTVTYERYPTTVRYTITYGYKINCTGNGKYNIVYDCEVPTVLSGTINSMEIFDSNYANKIAANNPMKSWNISGTENINYNLGLTATVECNSSVVSDLNGADALTLPEMRGQHQDLIAQYCNAQSNETTTFIDPLDANIREVAFGVLERAGTSNIFLVAKELFIWLKGNTQYKAHLAGDNTVQTAAVTLQCKTGDCDDLSFLYISLCRSLNIPARFIRGFLVEKDSAVAHAWVEVFVGGNLGDEGWIPVECAGETGSAQTQVNQYFGLESAEHLRLFKDDGSNDSIIASLAGLYYITYSQNRNIDPEPFVEVTNYNTIQESELSIDENGFRSYK